MVGRDKQVSSDLKNTEVSVETASDPLVRIFKLLTSSILHEVYKIALLNNVFDQYSFQLNSTKIMEWMDTRTVDTTKTKYQYAKWQMSRELRRCIRNEKLLLEIWENVQFVSTGGIALPRWIRYSKTRSIFLHWA